MGKAVQAVETLEPASKVHSGLAGVARMHGKSRKDPDTLIAATEWRIRLEHKMGGMMREEERSQPKPGSKTISHDAKRFLDTIEDAGIKKDQAYRYQVMSHCPVA